jgi:hypothetical protein
MRITQCAGMGEVYIALQRNVRLVGRPPAEPAPMNDHIINGRATARQHLLQLLRDVCNNATALCERDLIKSGQWQARAKPAISACVMLQRGIIGSHPKLSDELHILATEIRIALAAQADEALFAARIQKIRDAIRRVQHLGIDGDPAG